MQIYLKFFILILYEFLALIKEDREIKKVYNKKSFIFLAVFFKKWYNWTCKLVYKKLILQIFKIIFTLLEWCL